MGNKFGRKRGKYALIKINTGYFKNQGKYLTKNCLICNKEFSYFLSQNYKKFCSLSCYYISRKGKKRPEHSEFMKGKSFTKGIKLTLEQRQKRSGPNSYRWKGGITSLYHKIRRLPEYNQWRLKIFERDNFTCIKCSLSGIRLEADHIKQFFVIILENKITNYLQAIKCKELWDINNGRTLCRECHKKTETYGKNKYTPPLK